MNRIPVLIRRVLEIMGETIQNQKAGYEVLYLIEPADWVIRYVGENIVQNLDNMSARLATRPYLARKKLIHYGSINTFVRRGKIRRPHAGNRVLVTWFHLEPDDPRIPLVPEMLPIVDMWHTACRITRDKLIALGVPEDKIRVIPLGVRTDIFQPALPGEVHKIRRALRIPENHTVIGSFQKDGVGWGEGLEPKLVKGPDVFCDVVERLSEKYPVFVLLTGPARGYVKKRLTKAGIPFRHDMLEKTNDLPTYYKALDIYLITSREEGGPMSILESMASGVPLVSTRTGMAPDLVENEFSGLLVNVGDTEGIVRQAERLLRTLTLSKTISQKAVESARKFQWKNISTLYYQNLYKPLMKTSNQ